MKLYSNGTTDLSSGLVKVTARVLGIEYQEIDVSVSAAPAKDAKKGGKDKAASAVDDLKSKSLTGKFPVLETPEGFTIFEATSIAKYFARQRKGFYGNNDFESKRLANVDISN